MAKIRIVGDTSGYIEIAAPSAAGNNTLELPSSSTKLVGSDDNGNVNISGIITATSFSGNLNSTGVSTVTTLNATSIVGVTTAGITTAYINTLSGISTISADSAVYINQNLIFPSGKGIDFSATSNSSGTMTSELLADYEEGTFSPTAFGNSTAGTTTYGLQYGMYVKIGNLCHFQVRMQVTNMTGTGNLILGGLPFTVFNDSERAYASLAVGYLDNLVFGNVADTHLVIYTQTNSTNIIVRSSGNNRLSSAVPVDPGFIILYGGTYRTA